MSADAPPAEEPGKSLFDKLGAALPVALTAIATAFAGLSTSEMTQAMYWRSAAAQDQAKANDQWSLAGFKRDRSLIMQAAAVQLRAASGYAPSPFAVNGESAEPPREVPAQEGQPLGRQPWEWLAGQGPPKVELPPIEDQQIRDVLEMVQSHRSDAESVRRARGMDRERLDRAIEAAEGTLKQTDDDWGRVLKGADYLVQQAVADATKDAKTRAARASAAQAARYELDQRRYRAEATLNQQLGYLYEVRVKASTATSDRHRDRSKNFFYAMLAAQVGATVASLGLARKHGSALWLIAGLAGLVAVGFGVYVYLGM